MWALLGGLLCLIMIPLHGLYKDITSGSWGSGEEYRKTHPFVKKHWKAKIIHDNLCFGNYVCNIDFYYKIQNDYRLTPEEKLAEIERTEKETLQYSIDHRCTFIATEDMIDYKNNYRNMHFTLSDALDEEQWKKDANILPIGFGGMNKLKMRDFECAYLTKYICEKEGIPFAWEAFDIYDSSLPPVEYKVPIKDSYKKFYDNNIGYGENGVKLKAQLEALKRGETYCIVALIITSFISLGLMNTGHLGWGLSMILIIVAIFYIMDKNSKKQDEIEEEMRG